MRSVFDFLHYDPKHAAHVHRRSLHSSVTGQSFVAETGGRVVAKTSSGDPLDLLRQPKASLPVLGRSWAVSGLEAVLGMLGFVFGRSRGDPGASSDDLKAWGLVLGPLGAVLGWCVHVHPQVCACVTAYRPGGS